MEILFLTIAWPHKAGIHSHYTDLMECFREHGHRVTVVASAEERYGIDTNMQAENGLKVLRVRTHNLTKVGFIEKGWANLLIEGQFKRAINKYLDEAAFDLILMSTPPITLSGVYKFLKEKYKAKTYLLLKDIWPQGIADVGAIKAGGLIYKYFSRQEARLYAASDYIGCMSPANVKYVLKHNQIPKNTVVEENPNSLRIRKFALKKQRGILADYGVPLDSTIFMAGGNFGIPQGTVDFLQTIVDMDLPKAYFFLIGDGTEADKISAFSQKNPRFPLKFLSRLPVEDYELICKAVDVGLILLDGRYTIPNFPSRLLSYLENRLPILCYTDPNTDVGIIAEKYGCGLRVVRGDKDGLGTAIRKLACDKDWREKMGQNAFNLLKNRYTVERSYSIIMNHFEES